ncbi:MAG TPA: 3-deoxy-D-manno-octulosonic acid transferase [Chthonomonadaceae bacterium]|nr:3-deoxy-D-manno-octulosonic acid transferase [Chthonomonadaceae bacterium]
MLYNCILALGSPFVALYLLQRYSSGKSKPGWRERWGHLPQALFWSPGGRPRIWIHAVSAGEVVAAVPILQELRACLPGYELLLSTITPAGMEMAEQQAAKYVDALFYFPFDLPWVARRVVKAIRPRLFVSLESELWPNLLHELKRQGATTVMVNGRISDKNFRRASSLGGLLFRWMLSNMDRLLMQSAADAERIRALGRVLTEPGRVAVIGNSKFDQEIQRLAAEETLALRRALKLPDDAPVFVAGSTRSPEEEAEVLAAYRTMRKALPELCLLVAPRQVDRAEELAEAMRAAGLQPVRKTQIAGTTSPVHHLILDTMGELANVYAVGAFAFVGNSFPPVVKGGGQNLLQPLAHGKPVLFGPYTATIRSEVALTTEAGIGFQVADGSALAEQGLRLLHNDALRREIEVHALDLIAANRGVSARYAEAVAAMLDENAPPFDRNAGQTTLSANPRPTG